MENTNGDARASYTIIATADVHQQDETASSVPTEPLELQLNTAVQESDLEREKINLPISATKESRETKMLKSVNKLGYSEMKDIDPRRKGQNVASMTSKLTENLNVIHKLYDKWTQRPEHLSQPQDVKLNTDCVTMKNIEKDAMALSECL